MLQDSDPKQGVVSCSGVARAFPGGQNEEENEKGLRKSQKTWSKLEEKMRKVELLPNRDCEAGYGPGFLGDFSQKRELFSEETKNWGKRWVIEKFWPTFYANISFGKLWTQSNKKNEKKN